uniref:Uncharacterized protein n=1 Tax=Lepeophtheirus salmonis TaxID=72036 RepID=A0A0K2THB3_LEPSM
MILNRDRRIYIRALRGVGRLQDHREQVRGRRRSLSKRLNWTQRSERKLPRPIPSSP